MKPEIKFLTAVLLCTVLVLAFTACAGCIAASDEKTVSDSQQIDISVTSNEIEDRTHISGSSGSFKIDGHTISYDSMVIGGERTMDLTIDNEKYTLKAPEQDTVCGKWTGNNNLSISVYDDGTGFYRYPTSAHSQPFYWGKEDDGIYTFIFADKNCRTVTLSQNGLHDSMGGILQKKD